MNGGQKSNDPPYSVQRLILPYTLCPQDKPHKPGCMYFWLHSDLTVPEPAPAPPGFFPSYCLYRGRRCRHRLLSLRPCRHHPQWLQRWLPLLPRVQHHPITLSARQVAAAPEQPASGQTRCCSWPMHSNQIYPSPLAPGFDPVMDKSLNSVQILKMRWSMTRPWQK